MNKIEFLKKLKKKKIKYILLSDNNFQSLKKNIKDLDLFINDYDKDKFEKFISKFGYKRRIEKPRNNKKRDFYINIKHTDSFVLDISYDLSYRVNNFQIIRYNKIKDLFKKQISKKEIFFTSKKEFNYLRNLKDISYKRNKTLKINNLVSKKIISMKIKPNIFFNRFNFFGKNNYILFLGSDGVGKTTIIKKLSENVKFKTFETYFGLNKFKWYSNFNFNIYNNQFFKVTKISYIFLALDLIFRRLRIFRYSKNKIVLIDRFPGFIFFSRFEIFYKLFLPKPDLIVLLEAMKETRIFRKKIEFKNDSKKWKQIAKKINKPILIIQSDILSENEISKKIVNKIFSSEKYYCNFLE